MENKNTPVKIKRYASLDMWRGAACLIIAVDHTAMHVLDDPATQPHDLVSRSIFHLISLAWFGVPLFFVISGYCIANACDNLRYRPHSVRQFFYRRFRRVYPPYWIALGISVAVVAATLPENSSMFTGTYLIPNLHKFGFGHWMGNLTITDTWASHFFGYGKTYDHGPFIGQSWTIVYEEQFYAICGLALLFSRRRFFQIMLGITVIVFLLNFRHFREVLSLPETSTTGFFFDGRWLTFAAGVLVYYRMAYASGKWSRLFDGIMLISLCIAGFVCYMSPDRVREEWCVGLVFALLITFLYRWDAFIVAYKPLRPFVLCGMMSYSLYLVHWPLVKFIYEFLGGYGVNGAWPTLLITVPVSLVAVLLSAWVFYLLVERRFSNPPVIKSSAVAAERPLDTSAPSFARSATSLRHMAPEHRDQNDLTK